MTGNPEKLLPSDSNPQKQKITAIAFTISTTMPGQIGLESLNLFAGRIIEAIEFLYDSKEQWKHKDTVINSLEKAKTFLQIAIDEARPGGNSEQRYENVRRAGKKLRYALKYW